jgi:hypothetical protein
MQFLIEVVKATYPTHTHTTAYSVFRGFLCILLIAYAPLALGISSFRGNGYGDDKGSHDEKGIGDNKPGC